MLLCLFYRYSFVLSLQFYGKRFKRKQCQFTVEVISWRVVTNQVFNAI